jgi:hypothetical protein
MRTHFWGGSVKILINIPGGFKFQLMAYIDPLAVDIAYNHQNLKVKLLIKKGMAFRSIIKCSHVLQEQCHNYLIEFDLKYLFWLS